MPTAHTEIIGCNKNLATSDFSPSCYRISVEERKRSDQHSLYYTGRTYAGMKDSNSPFPSVAGLPVIEPTSTNESGSSKADSRSRTHNLLFAFCRIYPGSLTFGARMRRCWALTSSKGCFQSPKQSSLAILCALFPSYVPPSRNRHLLGVSSETIYRRAF